MPSHPPAQAAPSSIQVSLRPKPIIRSLSSKFLPAQFHFISTQNPNDAQDLISRRQARSHAVARGIENKRKLQQKTGHNFRFKCFKEDLRARQRCQNSALVASPWLLTDAPDLFQTLAAEAPCLRALQSWRTFPPQALTCSVMLMCQSRQGQKASIQRLRRARTAKLLPSSAKRG